MWFPTKYSTCKKGTPWSGRNAPFSLSDLDLQYLLVVGWQVPIFSRSGGWPGAFLEFEGSPKISFIGVCFLVILSFLCFFRSICLDRRNMWKNTHASSYNHQKISEESTPPYRTPNGLKQQHTPLQPCLRATAGESENLGHDQCPTPHGAL